MNKEHPVTWEDLAMVAFIIFGILGIYFVINWAISQGNTSAPTYTAGTFSEEINTTVHEEELEKLDMACSGNWEISFHATSSPIIHCPSYNQ